MAKIEINEVTSGYNLPAINAALQAIEAEFQNKVVYRDEVSPMLRDFDLNGYDLINVTEINGADVTNLIEFEQALDDAEQAAIDAQASADAAAASELAAANSAQSAASYAQLVEDAKLIWKGAWSGATAYEVNDAVGYLGASYICVLDHTNQIPPNASYWDVLAQKGSDGAPGPGSGDVSSNTATSVDGEIALFNGASGKSIKRATGTGLVKINSGVLATGVAGTDYLSPADIGTTVQAYGVDIATVAASQGEMEAGTETALRSMSPLRVKQAIAANATSGATQLFPISASVGSNELTLTLNPCSISFRDSTLTSGSTNIRTVAAPVSLVISNGSTLGTINGQLSRVVLIAIDNAGTVELAAVNLSGGVNLDETGVISTTAEGGAGAADSANVVYSTTARTNVPYRVVGIVESTQTTAGTWATSPSLVAGTGGQVLGAMMSLGYGQTWQSFIGSRSSGTTYYNTTGRPIIFSVAVSGTPSGVVLTVGGVSVASNQMGGTTSGIWGASAIVPPGQSYSATVSGSITTWSELR